MTWWLIHTDSTSAVVLDCCLGGNRISTSATPINILSEPLEEAAKCFCWVQFVTICQSREDMSGNFQLLWVTVWAKYKILLTCSFPCGVCWNLSWVTHRGCSWDDVDRCLPWRITRYQAVRKKNCWRFDIIRTAVCCDLIDEEKIPK